MFNWLRAKKFSIYLLQEVHCSENTAAIWSAEWGYKTLKKIGIKEDNMCTFCKIEVESLVHLFWFCGATSCFWRCFKQWLTTEKGMTDLVAINLTPAIIMGLKPHSFRDKQVHLFFLIARYFIWFSKMQDKAPDIQFFFTFLTSFL